MLPRPRCTSHFWHGFMRPVWNCREFLGILWISAVRLGSPLEWHLFRRMPSVSLPMPSALAGRARTWVCLSCMFWVRDWRRACVQVSGVNLSVSNKRDVIFGRGGSKHEVLLIFFFFNMLCDLSRCCHVGGCVYMWWVKVWTVQLSCFLCFTCLT